MNYQSCTLNLNRPLGTWLWDVAYYVVDPMELLSFCRKNAVTELYLSINSNVSDIHYVNLIKKCSECGIQVAALSGDASWVYPERRVDYYNYLRRVDSIHQLCADGPKFYALHIDANPHTLPEARQNNINSLIEPYIELIKDARKNADARKLKLEWDLPSWFYAIDTMVSGKNVAEMVMSLCDSVNILSFRDRAKDQMHSLSPNIEFAKRLKKPVRICFETLNMDESRREDGNSAVSYYEEGLLFMYDNLYKLEEMVGEIYGKFGFAIHDVKRWASLQLGALPQYAENIPGAIVAEYKLRA